MENVLVAEVVSFSNGRNVLISRHHFHRPGDLTSSEQLAWCCSENVLNNEFFNSNHHFLYYFLLFLGFIFNSSTFRYAPDYR